MTRSLLTPLLLVFLLVLGPVASACPLCDQPPASAPVADAPPEAAFEAAAPSALLEDERPWLLGLENGRYTEIQGRFSDAKAADPAHHLVTNAAASKLLGDRATERTAFLRTKAENGRLPEEFRREAVGLFWVRGMQVSPQDRAWLREATLPKAPEAPKGGPGKTSPTPPGAEGKPVAAGATPAQTAELLTKLTASLEIDRTNPKNAAALDEALANLVNTPTGRDLALDWVAFGAKAKVEFGPVDNSKVVVMNGRRILQASGGHTATSADPPIVTLNQDFLDTDPDFRRVKMAAILGHEMFGHAFEAQRSKRAGIAHDTMYYYRGDEAGAGLVGWLVQTELGGRLDNGHMWNYLADPERYHATLKTNLPYYSTTLSTKEMKAPIHTLESRVAGIDVARKSARDYEEAMKGWTPVIDHFVTTHKMEQAKFSSLKEDVDRAAEWAESTIKDNDAIEAHLKGTLEHWKKPEMEPSLKKLAETSGGPYLAEFEGRLSGRADRLRKLVAGRSQEPPVPPVPGKLTMDELRKMYEKDVLDNPKHWKK